MFVAAQMLHYEYQISYIRYHASSSFFPVLTPPVSFWGTVGNLVKTSIGQLLHFRCCMVLYVVKSHVS